VQPGRSDPDALAELARAALADGEEERALPYLAAATASAPNARLWQWKGLLERGLDAHGAALSSFATAARLAPSDPSIAHGRAQVALEAGVDAVAFFEQANRLAGVNADILLGLAAARTAAGRGDHAAAELDKILTQAPSGRCDISSECVASRRPRS
jgi:cytochrome c-type biogenesis protein CcmH/NrfG